MFMRKTRLFWLGLAVLAVAGLGFSACKKGETGLKFSHRFHIEEQEANCDDCHKADDEGNYSAPTMDNCKECHEIDEDNPSEECLVCHTIKGAENDYEVEEPAKPKGYADLIFSHEVHADFKCEQCHRAIATDRGLEQGPTMKQCLACHKKEDGPQECSACHEEISAEKAPESHEQNWESRHGVAYKLNKRNCQYCHPNRQAFCEKCHRTQKPRDHNFGWKTTGHGMEATHDRRLCATCHDAGYCVDCHRSQKPVSHRTAGWMSYRRENGHAEAAHRNFRSCNVCHETGECLQCHQNIILRKK